jgi:hypothetical protein
VDLTRTIGYRGFDLNSLTLNAGSNDAVGCEVKRVEWQGVPGVGYDEKRAMSDGHDFSDVYLSKRMLGMGGALYGRNRGEFYDLWQALVTALTPTNAYNASPGDRGFLPLDFWVPTADKAVWPSGQIHKLIYVRPAAQPSITFISDASGGKDQDALAATWDVVFEARDPRVYAYDLTTILIPSAHTPSATVTLVNKGDYPAPVNIQLSWTAGNRNRVSAMRVVLAGADATILVGATTKAAMVEYSAAERLITDTVGGVEALRMDIMTWKTAKTALYVPPGSHSMLYGHYMHPLAAGSRLWFRSSWA